MARNKNEPDESRYIFSDLAIKKLHSSGVNEKNASQAGMYSVENAKEEVDSEFEARPALVIPYFDIHGKPVQFARGGRQVDFVRVRYLGKAKVKSFIEKKVRRYAQMKGSGVHAYFPKIYDWKDIAQDTEQAILITEGELKALAACCRGYPTIGIGGVDCFVVRQEGNR